MNCFIPNILPCRIHHDGLVESVDRYWAPVHEKDNTQTAYFRGRKLRGRRVVLPEGYQGMECDSVMGCPVWLTIRSSGRNCCDANG